VSPISPDRTNVWLGLRSPQRREGAEPPGIGDDRGDPGEGGGAKMTAGGVHWADRLVRIGKLQSRFRL